MLEQDRKQAGWSVEREYREIEAGTSSPTFETWDRICKLYGWPQTFTKASR